MGSVSEGESAYAKRERFIEAVRKCEEESLADPVAYERKCKRIVATGYLFIVLVLMVLFGLIGFLVWLMISSGRGYAFELKLIIVLVISAGAIAGALFRRLPDESDGVELDRAEAPDLWEAVDRLVLDLKAPTIHRIRINSDWNASAAQIPAFGLFGPSRNTLRYGLPLITAESPDEFRATVAHELGHFTGDHSRFAGKVYRMFRVWEMAAHRVDGATANILMGPFLKWYTPKLWATTFPLRRQSEFVADEAATRIAGVEENGRGLVRMGAQSPTVASTWNEIYQRVEEEQEAPRNAISILLNALREPIESEVYRKRVADAMAEGTTYDDTHPCLRERLSAIGVDADGVEIRYEDSICKPQIPSAAQVFLGEDLQRRIEESLNSEWHRDIQEQWKARNKAVADKLKALHGQIATDLSEVDLAELKKMLQASLDLGRKVDYERLAEAVLEKEPLFPLANMVKAMAYAESKNAAAMPYFDRAASDPDLRGAAFHQRALLAEGLGRRDEAAKFYDLSIAEEKLNEKLNLEQFQFEQATSLVGLPLSDDDHRLLEGAIPSQVERMYSVGFISGLREDYRHQLLVIVASFSGFVMDEAAAAAKVADAMPNLSIPLRVLSHSQRKLEKKFREVEGALVWSKEPKK